MKNNKPILYVTIAVLFAGVTSLFHSCEIQENFSYQNSNSNASLGVNAWEYIQAIDSLSLFEEAIKLTNTESLYESSANKTFIAPSNQAFEDYLQDNAYTDLSEVPVPILRNTIKYHVVNATVSFDDPNISESNNPLPYMSENGQTIFLSRTSGYMGLVNEGTNKQWSIFTSNLKATNGIIHILPSIVYFSARSTSIEGPDDIVRDTIFPIADTYVNGGSNSGRNYGADVRMRLKNVTGSGGYDRKVFLMYNLEDFTKEGVIVDLKLELAVSFTAAKGIDVDVYNVEDTSWTEMGLTFDNANFPTTEPISTITSSKVDKFEFDIIDYYNGLDHNGRIALMVDQEAGKDETDEFHSKENTGGFYAPMLIARYASGGTTLIIEKNTGFIVNSGEAYALNNDVLEVSGSIPADVSFTIQQAPLNGWLIRGASVLQVGESFTQEDIDAMNVVYINNGEGTEDTIIVDGKDKAGATLDAFSINITVQ
ncbi:DNRLRE domain-containing protein [Algibacter miyuki]|uniref:DNRLRE domain-containing protein n=1 Tax=Algibacter miyuki TaxID=1306933 RepID=A0ABV5H2R2_9FLAO|nr:DNRLRE domain-containing protein [Algibacter miyuki]MDN3663873.1 DNRLRE domain-containing protein [Algibacter miyuki]